MSTTVTSRRPGAPPATASARREKGRRVRRGRDRAVLLGCLLGCLLGSLLVAVPAAVGDPGRAFPSRQQVDDARARAARKAQDVSVIKTQMLVADQRLQAASLHAEEASEAYNGAAWRLQQAKQAYRTARSEAARARLTVSSQRDRIGALVAQSYQQGGDLSAVNALLGADGAEGVLDQYAAVQGASTSLQADYQRFAASDAVAQVFERKARQAKAAQARSAARAKQAQARAQAAAEVAQDEAATIAAQKARLSRELARAQHVWVALPGSRQAALEEIAGRRAEERPRRAAAPAARVQPRQQAAARAASAARRHHVV